jgi:hypothetical protein
VCQAAPIESFAPGRLVLTVQPRMLYNSQIAALTFVLYEVVKKYAKIDLDDDD